MAQWQHSKNKIIILCEKMRWKWQEASVLIVVLALVSPPPRFHSLLPFIVFGSSGEMFNARPGEPDSLQKCIYSSL